MSDDASGTTVAATSWHPAGVCYASTDEGTRLPVVDITNQAFAIEVGVDDLPAFAEASRRSLEHWARVPRWLRRPLERRSLLLGDTSGRSAYVSGLTTYLLKLGPEPLAASIGLGGLDRRAAGAISSVAVRYRLRAVARLLADGLLPRLAADDGTPLLLLNLGGGPASDSLNALLLIRRERPELLRGRSVTIAVLDVDTVGPAFGRRCLDALVAPGAPLAGLDATFDVVPYDWADSSALRGLLNNTGPAEPIV
ncbi:MAG TPA: hypothetical protein VK576_01485, partial [Thermoleophilia bacterium]|nr:hypothetical protein [Thermoleophilia bacterium]